MAHALYRPRVRPCKLAKTGLWYFQYVERDRRIEITLHFPCKGKNGKLNFQPSTTTGFSIDILSDVQHQIISFDGLIDPAVQIKCYVLWREVIFIILVLVCSALNQSIEVGSLKTNFKMMDHWLNLYAVLNKRYEVKELRAIGLNIEAVKIQAALVLSVMNKENKLEMWLSCFRDGKLTAFLKEVGISVKKVDPEKHEDNTCPTVSEGDHFKSSNVVEDSWAILITRLNFDDERLWAGALEEATAVAAVQQFLEP